MKKQLLSFLFALNAVSLLAQPVFQRCQAHEHLQQQLSDPQQNAIYEQTQLRMREWLVQHPEGTTTRTTIYIPVIFHVVYSTQAGNISTQRLYEQVQILNEDFGGYNSDYSNTPAVWQPISGNTDIQFCLAQIDPQGNWTPGYEYVTGSNLCVSSNVFSAAPGWNPNEYLNIWVVECNNGLLGYSSFPGAASPTEDGVVITHHFIGQTNAMAPYNLGRTCTHEVGHWLNLFHISGDDGNSCTGDDQVSDTPVQTDQTYGCNAPGTVLTDVCSPNAPGVMWMNYMNYCDDACMYMFTVGQKARMWATLNGPRAGILASTKCQVTGIEDLNAVAQLVVSPNPTQGLVNVELPDGFGELQQVVVYSITGAVVTSSSQPARSENKLEFDLSSLESGVYFIELFTDQKREVIRVVRD